MDADFWEAISAISRLLSWLPVFAGIVVGLAAGTLSLRRIRSDYRRRHGLEGRPAKPDPKAQRKRGKKWKDL